MLVCPAYSLHQCLVGRANTLHFSNTFPWTANALFAVYHPVMTVGQIPQCPCPEALRNDVKWEASVDNRQYVFAIRYRAITVSDTIDKEGTCSRRPLALGRHPQSSFLLTFTHTNYKLHHGGPRGWAHPRRVRDRSERYYLRGKQGSLRSNRSKAELKHRHA